MKKCLFLYPFVFLLAFNQSTYAVLGYFGFGETEEQKELRLKKEKELEQKQHEKDLVEQWKVLSETIFSHVLSDDYKTAVTLWDELIKNLQSEVAEGSDPLVDDQGSYKFVVDFDFEKSQTDLANKRDQLVSLIKAKQQEEQELQDELKSVGIPQDFDTIKKKWLKNSIGAIKKHYLDGKEERKKQRALNKKNLAEQQKSSVGALDLTVSEKVLEEWNTKINVLKKQRSQILALTDHRKQYEEWQKYKQGTSENTGSLAIALAPFFIEPMYEVEISEIAKQIFFSDIDEKDLKQMAWRYNSDGTVSLMKKVDKVSTVDTAVATFEVDEHGSIIKLKNILKDYDWFFEGGSLFMNQVFKNGGDKKSLVKLLEIIGYDIYALRKYEKETIKEKLNRHNDAIKSVKEAITQARNALVSDMNKIGIKNNSEFKNKLDLLNKMLESADLDYKYNEKQIISKQTPFVNQVSVITRLIKQLPDVDRQSNQKEIYENQRKLITNAIQELNKKFAYEGIVNNYLK